MKKFGSEVFSVVVTFFPDTDQLNRLCLILKRCSTVIVVDNTPGMGEALLPESLCKWIANCENIGIARAQNLGIREALRSGAKSVAFFDQDSLPNVQLLPTLIAALGLPACGVAAPVCFDNRTGHEYPPYRFNRFGWATPVPSAGLTKLANVHLIISSGSVVAADVFRQVGLMEEAFFIDFVDLEWCIRCWRAEVPIRVIPTVTMLHSIGNKVVRNGSITTFVHSPSRAYYRLRNPFLLLRMSHIPRLYVLHEIVSAIVHHMLQFRHSQDPKQHLRMGWLGFLDGLRGLRGKGGLT